MMINDDLNDTFPQFHHCNSVIGNLKMTNVFSNTNVVFDINVLFGMSVDSDTEANVESTVASRETSITTAPSFLVRITSPTMLVCLKC
jgi:hypothetical protein